MKNLMRLTVAIGMCARWSAAYSGDLAAQADKAFLQWARVHLVTVYETPAGRLKVGIGDEQAAHLAKILRAEIAKNNCALPVQQPVVNAIEEKKKE